MTRRTQPILTRESGEFYIQKKGEGNVFAPLNRELDLVEIHRDLIDELDRRYERGIIMRMLCIPPYIRGPRTYVGIAKETGISRYKVKKIFFQAIKKIRRIVYAEAKAALDK